MNAAIVWSKANYKDFQSDVFLERYDNRSNIQNYVRGKISTDDCMVALTNWYIEARAYDFAPVTKAADAVTRKIIYTDSVTKLQKKWIAV